MFTDDSSDLLARILSGPLSQNERLLTLQLGGTDMIPHRLVGEERVSRPFTYTLDVISQRGDIELKSLIAQSAQLTIRQADGHYRPLHGLVESAALLGEDGGVYYYQLVLVPWLAMLNLGRDSRIFQDKTVVEILDAVFEQHETAQGRWRFDLRREYPSRSFCVQYRESDAHFVSRLVEQEGLFYYWEHADSEDDFNGHRLVITDDVATCTPVAPQTIRFHRQAATEHEDAITQWSGQRRQQAKRVSLATFDYKQPRLEKRTGLETIRDQGNLPDIEVYDYPGEYYYHDYPRGERLTVNRMEALESRAKRFHGAGGTRQLAVGQWFELSQHARHAHGDTSERQFLVLGLSVHAENALPVSTHLRTLPGSLQEPLAKARKAHGLEDDSQHRDDYQQAGTGHYLVDFEAQRLSQPYRSTLDHPRPEVTGPQTAIVVGPEDEEIHTDHLNRVKVQFHWDRQGQRNDHSSCWLRVSQPNADAGWGGVFVPRIGQEMIVSFIESDPDRPMITGRVYNGDQTPEWHSNGILSGFKTKTYRGGKYNELVFDDATDQERIRLNSEHDKSQLNLGYLIHQNGNSRGAFRGTGFELRSDAYGAIRADKGLLLTSWGQIDAGGEQLDLTPATEQLHSAHRLADSLSDSATQHNAEALDARDNLKQAGDDSQSRHAPHGAEAATNADQSTAQGASQAGRGEASRLEAPWLHLSSPAGIALSTPSSTHLAQGKSLSVSSGEDINLATGKSLIGALGDKLSLFVQRAGIKLFAAKGKVDVQAQSDEMALTAEKDLKVTSTEHSVNLAAAEEVLLVCGGAYVRIKGGNIDLHAPGKIDVKGVLQRLGGPTSMSYALEGLPNSTPSSLDLEHVYANGEPVSGAAYRATLPDGSVLTGVLDELGKASLAGVSPGGVEVEYFQDPDDIEQRPQEWAQNRATPPDLSALASGSKRNNDEAAS
ncbi:type VI secretion system Vgr family protein [Halomonas binhaiensis]|uniref:Type VI secretion system tip protein VgrG n=1 Tax=Halomonas binhaiensis TaxID=2562282 RepID=A0A5C1NKN6_9GAMM|nr:type VI secretion system tip protein TssI/VgrG [Halomonas binhaiensis]QEM82655.1 type VI secretion system tip protein VgrG [Halomonas binhaiensis]